MIAPDLQVGDEVIVPRYGPGKVLGFQGRREGLRDWLYILVGLSPTLRVLVPVREGVVVQ